MAERAVLTPTNTEFETHRKVFRQALRYGDFAGAAIAVNYMLVTDPSQKSYRDTLALIYTQMGASVQALGVAKDVLKDQPDNNAMMEVAASALEAVGQNVDNAEEAMGYYKSLAKATSSPYYTYKVASIQYLLRRFAEAELTTRSIFTSDKADNEKIAVNVDRNQRQEVPLKAATYNLLGMTWLEQKDFDKARANFNEALKIEPNFVLAKNNLDLVTKVETDEKKPKAPAGGTGPTKPKTGK